MAAALSLNAVACVNRVLAGLGLPEMAQSLALRILLIVRGAGEPSDIASRRVDYYPRATIAHLRVVPDPRARALCDHDLLISGAARISSVALGELRLGYPVVSRTSSRCFSPQARRSAAILQEHLGQRPA